MYEAKTKPETDDVKTYLLSLTPERRREDALKLLAVFQEETGWPAELWTGGMVGFGRCHYKYETGHEGDALRVGFASRKGKISLYTWLTDPQRAELLSRLGKHTSGVGCVYVNKLADIDEGVLREIIRAAVQVMEERYPREQG